METIKLNDIMNQDDLLIDDDNICGENPFLINQQNKIKLKQEQKQEKCKPNEDTECQNKCQITKTCNNECSNKNRNYKKGKFNIPELCQKCKQNTPILKIRSDYYCKQCFTDILEHKFKVVLRKHMNVNKSDKLLVCLSGGMNSVAMVKMFNQALFNYKQRKMFFSLELLHIDESSICSNAQEYDGIIKGVQMIKNFSQEMGLKLNQISIEDIYDTDFNSLVQKIKHNDSNCQEILDQIEACKKQQMIQNKREKLQILIKQFSEYGSTREDIIQNLKTFMITNFGLQHNFTKIVVGESGQRTASKLLSSICKGRGIDCQNVGYYYVNNYLNSGLGYGKVMRDFLLKEIQLYLHHCQLNQYVLKQNHMCFENQKNKKLPGYGNIDLLMDEFINEIQSNTVSSVHTVLNAADKMIIRHQYSSKDYCGLCLHQRDKLVGLLEVEGVHQYLKTQDLKEDQQTMASTLVSNYVKSKEHSRVCFGCMRLLENSTQNKQDLPDIMKLMLESQQKLDQPKDIFLL